MGEPPIDGKVGSERKERSNERKNHRQLRAETTTGPSASKMGRSKRFPSDRIPNETRC